MFVRAVLLAMACLAAIAASAGSAAGQPAVPQAKISERIVCSSLIQPQKFPSEAEKACLPRLSGFAAREGSVLRIALRDGTTKAFKDAPISCHQSKAPNACIYYTLHSYHPENDAVVIERWVDRGPVQSVLGTYMLERATGRIADLPSEPYYSPDGSRFFSVRACGHRCPNRIDIWSVQDGAAKLEWRHRVRQEEPKTLSYEFAEWQGNEQVKLRILPEVPCECGLVKDVDEARAIVVNLTRTGQSWTLDPQLPQ